MIDWTFYLTFMYLDKIWQPKSAWHLSIENTLPSLAVFPAVPLETAFAGRRVFGLAHAQRSVPLSLCIRMRTDVRHVVITPPHTHTQNGDSVLKAIPKYLGRPRILPFQQPKMHWCSKILKIVLIFFLSVEVMVEQVWCCWKSFVLGVARPLLKGLDGKYLGLYAPDFVATSELCTQKQPHIMHGHICVWTCVQMSKTMWVITDLYHEQ